MRSKQAFGGMGVRCVTYAPKRAPMRLFFVALFVYFTVFCAGCSLVSPGRGWFELLPPPPEPSVLRPLEESPKWMAVLLAERNASSFSENSLRYWPQEAAAEWLALKERFAHASLEQKAAAVNVFFNAVPYVADAAAWGVEEHWARPVEFMTTGGDCEDYAIAKYLALRDLGVPDAFLRVAAVWNKARKEGHAVLVVYVQKARQKEVWVLDNLERGLPRLHDVPWYAPQYYVNGEAHWVLPGAP